MIILSSFITLSSPSPVVPPPEKVGFIFDEKLVRNRNKNRKKMLIYIK